MEKDKLFGGCTVVNQMLEYPLGVVLLNDKDMLKAIEYVDPREEEFVDEDEDETPTRYESRADYVERNICELGNYRDIFYDENGELRSEQEVMRVVDELIIADENFDSDYEEILVDEEVAYIYEKCKD